MKVMVERQEETHLAWIRLEIPAEHAQAEYNKACKRLSQRLNIPGFRRGKAPRSVIEKTVGVDRLQQEALDRILPNAFADAISEHQLDPVAAPQVEEVAFNLNEGVKVKAKLELRPTVTLPDLLRPLQVKVPAVSLAPDAEEKELNSIISRMTRLEPVIDRPSEEKDIVNIDFTGAVGGEPIRGGSAKNFRVDLTENNLIEGFSPQLVGRRIAEEFAIQVKFPADYHDTSLAGKDAEFQIKMNDIKRRVVPELTDELAKKVGPFETLNGLKDHVKSLLDARCETEMKERKEKALVQALLDASSVDVPDAMVNREAKLLMEEVRRRLQSQGVPWEKFIDAQGHEEMWENLRQEGSRRIKTSLVMGEVAKKEQLKVSDDDMTDAIRDILAARKVDEKTLMRNLANNPDAVQSIIDFILAGKVVKLLQERAEFEILPATMAAATATAADATASQQGGNAASLPTAEEDFPPAMALAGTIALGTGEEPEEFEVIDTE
jgi:trigger factor